MTTSDFQKARIRETCQPLIYAGNKLQAKEMYKKGLLNYRQHSYHEASDCWKKVLVLDPENTDAKRGLERIEAILSALDKK